LPERLSEHLLEFLGATACQELKGGHQARVFRVSPAQGETIIAKVLADGIEQTELECRVGVIASLSEFAPQVCRPLPVRGRLVNQIAATAGPAWLTCYEDAGSRLVDPLEGQVAGRMGHALAQLHAAMRRLPQTNLPVVGALRAAGWECAADDPPQLLHGDFNASNLRECAGHIRVFDFDDCGYGPTVFDVANALFMVLFDATVGGRVDTYETFASEFVAAYDEAAGYALRGDALKAHIDGRVATLKMWLDNDDLAPAGIRNASPAWRGVLRGFVSDYRPQRD
jgi:Ser/Thr protein kinase RdoA (MazF antagonist)